MELLVRAGRTRQAGRWNFRLQISGCRNKKGSGGDLPPEPSV